MLSPSRTGNKPFFPISPKNKRNNSFLSEEKEKRGRRKWLYLIISMAENKQIPPPYDLDAKWDACLDLTVRRFVYSSFAGAFGGLLLFRSPVTRWASVAFGAGLGLGSAYTECSQKFGGYPAMFLPPKISDAPASQEGQD